MKQFVVYEKKSDSTREYFIDKATINENEIVRLQESLREKLEVIAVFGHYKTCIQVTANFLMEKKESIHALLSVFHGKKEVVVLLTKETAESTTKIVVFYMKIKNMFKERPFPINCPGLTFLKSTLDLSKTIICCGSEKTAANWFLGDSSKGEKLYPDCPNVFINEMMRITTREVDTSNLFIATPINYDTMMDARVNYFNNDLSNITYSLGRAITEKISRESLIFDTTRSIREILTKYCKQEDSEYYYSYYDVMNFSELEDKVINILTRCRRLYREGKEETIKMLKAFNNEKEDTKVQYKELQDLRTKKIKEIILAKFELEEEKSKHFGFKKIMQSELWDSLKLNIRKLYKSCSTNWSTLLDDFKELVKSKIGEKKEQEDSKLQEDFAKFFEQIIDKLYIEAKKEMEDYAKIKEIIIDGFISKIKGKMNEFEYITQQLIKAYEVVCDRDPDGKLKNLRMTQTTFSKPLEFRSQCDVLHIFQINDQRSYIIFVQEKDSAEKKIIEYCYSRKTKELTKLVELPISKLIVAYHQETMTLAGMDNEKCVLYYGQIDELGKWLQQPYNPFASAKDLPGQVINLSFYPGDSYRMLLLMDDGTIYQFNIRSQKLEKIEHKENDNGVLKIAQLNPSCKTDSKYEEIHVCDAAKMIFLRSKSVIDCYNVNWIQIHSFKLNLKSRFLGLKVFSNQVDNMLVLFNEKSVESYVFQGSIGAKELTISREEYSTVPGNPLLDSIYYGLKKFNPKSFKMNDLCICLQDFKLGPEDSLEDNKYIQYAKDCMLNNVFKRIFMRKLRDIKFSGDIKFSLDSSKDNFLWMLRTRLPIQITTIEEANMIPLKDGINQKEEFNKIITESRTLTEAIVNYVHFGIYENMLKDVNMPVTVIGIVGKQSSGKSYFMNQMFSTIFDVSGTRCTDGIWMSISKVDNRIIVVFDCEGLFSIRRVEMEEIKLCTTLAAVCDILILNQDLNFSRQLSSLFNKFNKSIGRIGGKNLFKGALLNLVRDVPNEAQKDSINEWESTVKQLFEKKEYTFIEKLFSGVTQIQPVHYYEHPSFSAEVRKTSQIVTKIKPRWENGKEFLDSLKLVLSHIYTDDDSCIDNHYFMLNANRLMDSLKDQWIRCDHLKDKKQSVEMQVDGKTYEFAIELAKLELCEELRNKSVNYLDQFFDFFKKNLYKNKLNELIDANKDVNLYRNYFRKFFNASLEVRKKTLLLCLDESLPKGEQYIKEHKDVLERAKGEFSLLAEPYKQCTDKCKRCFISCWLFSNHEGPCDCSTDHKCHKLCEGCKNETYCDSEGGHAGMHFCKKKQHLCEEKCKYCDRTCKNPTKHESSIEHICAERHPCNVKCKVEICKGYCNIDVTNPHDEHVCIHAVLGCPYQCIRCKKKCNSSDHYHNNRDEIEEVTLADNLVKVHLCEETHSCTENCRMEGICQFDFVPEEKEWNNGITKFPYTYLKPIQKSLTCKIVIPAGEYTHEGKHNCGMTHTCKERCIECKSFCKGEIGHSGKHFANIHRNKENSFFVSESKDSKIAIPGKDGRIYRVGENAVPEDCSTSCLRRGRAHFHLKLCPGGDKCAGKRFPAVAKHSAVRYYPYSGEEMDLWLCDAFWDSYDWETPYFKNETAKATIPLCSFYCSADLHKEEKIFCNKKAWHTDSSNYEDHVFTCKHETGSGRIDVVFCCDTTGSMSSYIEQAKVTINKIKSDIMSSKFTSIHFAFIGYKDHCDPKVVEYRDLTENTESLFTFISSIVADGGGDGPEAVADGLHQASSMSWRADSTKFLVHILDWPPHGSEFGGSGDSSPSGCGYSGQPPCPYRNYKESLEKLNALKVKYIVVKCTTLINAMIDIFRASIPSITAVDISNAIEMPLEVTTLMCKTLENKELTFAKAE